MAKTMKPVDAVTIGVGWTGGIIARELTKAGLTVVGLERGDYRNTVPDFLQPASTTNSPTRSQQALPESRHRCDELPQQRPRDGAADSPVQRLSAG